MVKRRHRLRSAGALSGFGALRLPIFRARAR